MGAGGNDERQRGVVETLLPCGPREADAQHRALAPNVVAGEQVLSVADVEKECPAGDAARRFDVDAQRTVGARA